MFTIFIMSLSLIPHKKRIHPINYESEATSFKPSRKLVPSYMTKTAAFVNRPTGRRHIQPPSEISQPPLDAPYRPHRRPAPPSPIASCSLPDTSLPTYRPCRRLFPEHRVSAVSLVWTVQDPKPRVRPLHLENFAALCSSTAETFQAARSARLSLVQRERGTPDLLSWR